MVVASDWSRFLTTLTILSKEFQTQIAYLLANARRAGGHGRTTVKPSIQHGGLSPARWAGFSFDQQILMIGNEMNRGLSLLASGASDHARRGYERVLQLVDLTVVTASTSARRRELLRWRDLVAALYLAPEPDAEAHRCAFRCLLQFTPAASRQIEPLLGPRRE